MLSGGFDPHMKEVNRKAVNISRHEAKTSSIS